MKRSDGFFWGEGGKKKQVGNSKPDFYIRNIYVYIIFFVFTKVFFVFRSGVLMVLGFGFRWVQNWSVVDL